jgi:hypothetical protein
MSSMKRLKLNLRKEASVSDNIYFDVDEEDQVIHPIGTSRLKILLGYNEVDREINHHRSSREG